jgi:hypothetical protein
MVLPVEELCYWKIQMLSYIERKVPNQIIASHNMHISSAIAETSSPSLLREGYRG